MIGRGIGIPFRHGTGGGTSIPPEIKKSIIAWYSPYKQKLTNYDVIESYADDFTKWRIENTGVTSTQKKIVIAAGTELKYNVAYKGFGNSIAKFDIKYTGNAVIRYQYNKEDGTTGIITINRSGIYHLPASIKAQKNFGFYCNPQTVTEEATIEQLPTSILKDLSGNGNHAYLYGGKGKLNSGMGVYEVDFTTYYGDVINSYTGRLTSNNKKNLGIAYNKLTKDIEPYTVKVTGIRKEIVRFTYRNEEGIEKDILIKNDGYYTVPKCYKDGTQGSSTTFVLFANYDNDTEVIIEQIPDYPDQLCYDGKMYAVAYDMPILTDYTVMAERTWFEKEEYSAFISNSLGDMEAPSNGAFSVELKSLNSFTTISFGSITSIGIPEKGITYQTKQSYNGNSINVGTKESNDILILGGRYFYKNDNAAGNTWTGCHGAIIVADRSFTEEEINWLKQNWDKI
jgi:hypothetical protein